MNICVHCGKEHDREVLCNDCIKKMADKAVITRQELSGIMDDVVKELEKDGFVLVSSTSRYVEFDDV